MGTYRFPGIRLIPPITEPCKAIALHHDGTPVLLPSGDRLCCTRTYGHFPWIPHADQDDDGKLVEWR